jgi:alkylated DNA repair dioxygenase AlkB
MVVCPFRHVDHLEYSGGHIVGLSLLSHAVMLLEAEAEAHAGAAFELLLPPRSLYVLRGEARYRWGHSVPLEVSFEGRPLQPKGRRISILLRDRPPEKSGAPPEGSGG